ISKINQVMLTRKYVKNWVSVVFRVFNHKEITLLMRSGVTIGGVSDPIALVNLLGRGWEIEENSELFIVVKNKDNIKLKCRLKEGFDLGHLLEIFEADTYLQNFQNSIVIDIGASTADSSIYFVTKGAKEVYGVEPMKESFDLAVYNVKINNLESKVHLINAALSPTAGKIELTVSSQNPNANSINPTEAVKKKGIIFDSKREIDSISLKDIISQYGLSKIDLLKMDCEGCEYSVLQSIDKETLTHIENIVLEFHDGVGFLADLLSKQGYKVTYNQSKGLGILQASRNAINADQSLISISNNTV
ncbi:MAG: FkbM family methyltransferase, partial [Candidatus Thermoplasmatota archaeon]|nr:FkbM family methyltransferase [Candidatus Thermoplasmatota archaeon]